MPKPKFDLFESARAEMQQHGFATEFPDAVQQQVRALDPQRAPSFTTRRDLCDLAWSSIDNSTSTDLDQIEVAFPAADEGVRILVAIADVDDAVPAASPLDRFASEQSTSVYVPGHVFPMLPDALSSGLTSLRPDQNRPAVVIDMLIDKQGDVNDPSVYRALVRNHKQLDYARVAGWLERPQSLPAELKDQLTLQEQAALRLRAARQRAGALLFDRTEVVPVLQSGQAVQLQTRWRNRATTLIEELMIAANEVIAQTLEQAGAPAIQRVVRSPERWPRIVALAAQHGTALPEQADSGALAAFLATQERDHPDEYPDLSLSVLKLMGSGEYVVLMPGAQKIGHFGLAAGDYTHSTAPNRRFADLVTQRLIKCVLKTNHNEPAQPYPEPVLEAIAKHCTEREDAARKVQRTMQKRAAAQALSRRVGQSFRGVITGVTPKGVFARVNDPPVEGRVLRGERGLDVGDRVRLTLLSVDPAKGFIDFGK